MDISIVVPFHNEQRYIERCLAALLSQRYPRDRYEIVFIDNNSTDRSAEIVKQYPDVRLLSERTPGPYAARNRGVAATTGAIVAFTDSDCSPDSDWLAAISRQFASPGTVLVQGRVRFADESAALSVLADYENAKAAYVASSQDPGIYYGYTNNMAVRRAAFDRAGPFEESERGADVVFVHHVIDAYSPASIRFSSEMSVRHWEIDSVRRWFGKLRIYGRSIRRYGGVVRARPLNSVERWRVLRTTTQSGGYPWYRSALLTGLLLSGACVYELGRTFPQRS